MTGVDASYARRLWLLFEPIHAVVYFSPVAKPAYEAAGLKGGWMGYFASRAAAMGPVSAEVVIATFYNFHPDMVRRAIPDAWRFSKPERVLEARLEVAGTALGHVFDTEDASQVLDCVAAARAIATHADPRGRALFAAHSALAWPDDPQLALWHACTLLREFRGDGHVVALVTHGIDGCEAHVLAAAAGAIPADEQRSYRGWSAGEWSDAQDRLRDRGLLDASGALTDGGRALRAEIDDLTNRLALPPFEAAGKDVCTKFETSLAPLVARLTDSGAVRYPNPIGLPAPSARD